MKKKIFVDTNIWLRFLLADKPEQYEDCKNLFLLNEQGRYRIYTSTIVLLEIIYTLTSFYKIPKREILVDIGNILLARNLTLLETTNLRKALTIFKSYQIKFADCLIASQLPKNILLCTYDLEFKKIKKLSSYTPREILS